MLMLEDLKRRSELIDAFDHSLTDDKYLCMVTDGKLVSELTGMRLTKEQIVECKTKFNNADLSFAGVSHGRLIKPLFALCHDRNARMISIKEYLTFSNESVNKLTTATVEHDLTMLAIVVSIYYPEITKIYFPVSTNEFSNNECFVKKLGKGTILTIKKNSEPKES